MSQSAELAQVSRRSLALGSFSTRPQSDKLEKSRRFGMQSICETGNHLVALSDPHRSRIHRRCLRD